MKKLDVDRNMKKMDSRILLAALVLLLSAVLPCSQHSLAQSLPAPSQEISEELEERFQQFLDGYWPEIKKRNHAYLNSVHPILPEGMYDFFFDITLDMMRHSEENTGIEPTIECQDFEICKVVYPQPNDSWAAQRFILHEDAWRWLDQ